MLLIPGKKLIIWVWCKVLIKVPYNLHFLYTSCTSAFSWHVIFNVRFSTYFPFLHCFIDFILISLFNCLSFHFWIIMIFSFFSVQISLSLCWRSPLFQWIFNDTPGIDSILNSYKLYLKVQRQWVSIAIS